jgi:membrane AbrB-like protein
MNLILTLIIGMIGGLIALKFKIPAGAMIGAMLAVALFNIITGDAYLPQNVKIVTQIAAGAYIGSGVRKKDVLDLRFMIKPAILMVSGMIILDLFMGYIMYKITEIDLVTSLFACAPGGLIDMSLISNDLGADSAKVAILQLVRLMSVLIIFPPMMKLISARRDKLKLNSGTDKINADITKDDLQLNVSEKNIYSKQENYLNLLLTMIIALVAGLIGYSLKVPAGALTLSMAAVGALNIYSGRGYMPLNIRKSTQICAGALIGERMTFSDIIALQSVILPAFILLVGIILVNLILGFLISKISRLDIVTSLLASAPGGLSDMALIAKDLGGDGPKVAILQLVRYVCVIAIFPLLIKYICTVV